MAMEHSHSDEKNPEEKKDPEGPEQTGHDPRESKGNPEGSSDQPVPKKGPGPIISEAVNKSEAAGKPAPDSTGKEDEPPLKESPPTSATPPPTQVMQKPITRRPFPAKQEEGMQRRTFIKWLTVGWAAFAAIVLGYGSLFLRYLFPNVLFEPKQSFRAGYPQDYQVGEVSEKYKSEHGVWIVRDPSKVYALSTVCTHLGCTPNWLANESKFKCPCHGSGFYKTGINFEGPAPRPLERFKVSLSDDGEIIVDKTKKFQQEKGEWSDPESYILV